MSGRGDNNKHGSAGRGARNQSNQGFVADDKDQRKSNHKKEHTGGRRSENQEKTQDQDANRDHTIDKKSK